MNVLFKFIFGLLVLFVAIFALFALVMLVFLSPLLLFYKALTNINKVAGKGNLKIAYSQAQRLLRFVSLPIVSCAFQPIPEPLYFQLSRLAEKQDDFVAAIDWLKPIAAPPYKYKTYSQMVAREREALLLRKQNRDVEAAAIEAGLQEIPLAENDEAQAGIWLNISNASATIRRGHFHLALEMLSDSRTQQESQQVLYIALQEMYALRFLGKYEEAITRFDLFEEKFSSVFDKLTNSKSTNTIAQITLQKKNHDAYVDGMLTMISLCLEAGRVGSAQEHWESLSKQRISEEVRPIYHAVHAWLCAVLNDRDQAMKYVHKAEQQKPVAPLQAIAFVPYLTYPNAIIRTYLTLGDYSTAASRLTEIIAQAETSLARAEYMALLADCYRRSERMVPAKAMYEQVVAAGFAEAVFTQQARIQLANLRSHEESFLSSALWTV